MSDYISHHGIKGQRWGVRRYQNPDGSLTAAGEKRYNAQKDKYERAEAKQLKRDLAQAERIDKQNYKETVRMLNQRDKMAKSKKTDDLDLDLQDMVIMDRMNPIELASLAHINNEMKTAAKHIDASYREYLKDNGYFEDYAYDNKRVRKAYYNEMDRNPNEEYMNYQRSKDKYDRLASDLGKSVVGPYVQGSIKKDKKYRDNAAETMKAMAMREDNMDYILFLLD